MKDKLETILIGIGFVGFIFLIRFVLGPNKEDWTISGIFTFRNFVMTISIFIVGAAIYYLYKKINKDK